MRILTLAFLGIFGAAVHADEEVHRTMDASDSDRISVSNIAGSVEVQGWSRNEVEVTGELGDDVEELVFERNGDEIEIKVKTERKRSADVSSDLYIRMPEGASLEVNTVSADIDIMNIGGEQDLESVSGDITTEADESDIDVTTVSGDLEITANKHAIRSRLSSVSGDIDTVNLAGEIGAGTVSGDLVIANGVFRRAAINTVNGDIVFHAQLLDDGRLDVETVNGSVDVEFAGEVNARFDIETFNGDIDNCFGPKAERVSKYAPGYELKFTEGTGSARVTIETLNGDLTLCK